MLGVPISHPAEFLTAKLPKLEEALEVLQLVSDKMASFHLLRFCLSASLKINHILRATDPDEIQQPLQRIDTLMDRTLERFLGVSLSESSAEQAYLPFKLGAGLGLRYPSEISLAAFLASLYSVSKLGAGNGDDDATLNFESLIEDTMHAFNSCWGLTASIEDVNGSRAEKESLQGALCRAYETAKATRFLQDLSPDQLPWIQSSSHRVRNFVKRCDRRTVWEQGVIDPLHRIPAVILGLLLNILDALSYGMILFPLGQPIFENLGPDGISMFYVSCIISQLVYSLGGSVFKGGIGSEMVT